MNCVLFIINCICVFIDYLLHSNFVFHCLIVFNFIVVFNPRKLDQFSRYMIGGILR